jgi:predicted transcriptional regulator
VIAVLMGIYAIYSGQYLLLFIAFLVFSGAQREEIVSEAQHLAAGVPVRAAMSRSFQTVEHGSTIGEAAQAMENSSQQEFPVLHGDRVIGVVSRAAVANALKAEGPNAYIAGITSREFVAVTPEMDLAGALAEMQRTGSSALVIDEGRLAGLLTIANIGKFFALRSAQTR